MAIKRFLTGINLSGNQLINVRLAEMVQAGIPFAFGTDAEGYLIVNDAEGNPRRFVTQAELNQALADALDSKFDKTGGELTGAAAYADGVVPTEANHLVHQAYVDNAVNTAISQNAARAGEFVEISEQREITVDRTALSTANSYSAPFAADETGVVNFVYTVEDAAALSITPSRVKWAVEDSTGQEVSFVLSFTATTVTVTGTGADALEAFVLNGQA